MNAVQAQMFSFSGIAEGVASGITIAIILGIYAFCKRLWARRKQVKHLRHLIYQGYERIAGGSDFSSRERVIPVDMLQYYLFKNIHGDLNDVLRFRADSLSFKQVDEIKVILVEIDCMASARDFGVRSYQNTPDMEFYEKEFFEKFRKLKWLSLPKKPDDFTNC